MRVFIHCMFCILLAFAGCRPVDVYEKTAGIPRHAWASNHKVVVELDIKDSAFYNVIFVIRHTEKYRYTGIVSSITIHDTAAHTQPVAYLKVNVPLVTQRGSWAGDNVDDLFYHRSKINQPIFFKAGRYRFVLQHEMKENPLPHILKVGVAIEKAGI